MRDKIPLFLGKKIMVSGSRQNEVSERSISKVTRQQGLHQDLGD